MTIQQTPIKDKIILALNAALSMENAAIERLENRIGEASLPDAKHQLQHHLEETQGQQQKLQQLISTLGGTATQEKAGLPLPSFPQSIKQKMEQSLTKEEWELKSAEEDMIVESAEIAYYNTILQTAQVLRLNDVIEPLTSILLQEEAMAQWIKTNTPKMVSQLLSKMQQQQ